jgi:hypothetical protein
MAATAFAVQIVPHAGLNPVTPLTTGLATFTHTSPCGPGIALMLVNGAASTCVITLHVPAAITFDGLVIPNRTVTLPATIGAITLIPMVAATYGDPTTGLCTFDVAAGTVSGAVIYISA